MLLELLLTVSSSCVPPRTREVVGLWEFAPPAGHAGMEHAIELRADGTFTEAVTVMMDGKYRVSGGRLAVVYDRKADVDTVEAVPFKVTVRTLTRGSYDPKKGRVQMVRVGTASDPKAPVVGVWRYRHYTGGTAFEKFMPDGRLLFRLPMPNATSGCFTVRDTVVSLPGQILRQAAGDVLKPEADVEGTYQRVEGGGWYPLTANRTR